MAPVFIALGLLVAIGLGIGYRGLPPDQQQIARAPLFWLAFLTTGAGYAAVFLAHGWWRAVGGAVMIVGLAVVARRWPGFGDRGQGRATLRYLARDLRRPPGIGAMPTSEIEKLRLLLHNLEAPSADKAPVIALVAEELTRRGGASVVTNTAPHRSGQGDAT